ncbi:MAG: UDP-N-acetylglucosamine--N-acetylmuramyl-(pentapeptide) pyrophosphoryl-undecaprenol N-acetylglucosamine transferase [Candidatus Komeilibacteria bacterium]|jgi:UDP-N-acetylglucosamine--N-acetylmuramyl-(pentapeptide) pyrophosphoryl-undecaprenol N-acetylglucosamine transferase|nr:UDP-N-acetylglucosamine--N-acetylmuramyl-(pentapeptide) pyrophosphoryl-undecaprenol N-acetylglucosamine transferase [Candidatus Komeilibacteria bacterium]MBT4447173.1 UDP-N-acetylglucosamine--N-acetylmuramyl-(pentapeptide) pyrophosphoryl-undecaprenol N-acetylglucosamine transferase [Candidatus Komeilibacteria bacterium]
MQNNKKKILLVGGGTLGSVSPLLAIADKYKAEYLFVGSEHGPEKDFVISQGIENFLAIKSGKLRRYFSWQNFTDIIRIKLGFFQSLKIIWQFKPDIILTAGSFVAVPVVWAAWLMRKPVVVHQQDLLVGLANKLMVPFAKKITVVFPAQTKDFDNSKTVVTGNPVRKTKTSLDKTEKLIVITGGGLGARSMNEFLKPFIPKMTEAGFKVYHLLGSKNIDQALELDGYYSDKFVKTGMIDILSQSDIIISRAGMSLTSEAAALKKALVLIPITDTHQERNAAFLAKNNAAVMIRQGNNQIMDRYLDKLLAKQALRDGLGDNLYKLFPKNAVNDYIILIDKLLNE